MERNTRSFNDLFKNGRFCKLDKFCDTTIVSKDGAEFKAHKLFLSMGSEYFHALYKSDLGKGKETSVLQFDEATVENCLVFLYTGEIHLNDRNISSILLAADYLLINALLCHCKYFVLRKISLNCCVPLLIASNFVDRLEVADHCYRFVLVHFQSLINGESSDIAELPLSMLKKLLADESLGVADEESIWKAIVMWVDENKKERLKHVPELLPCIRWCSENYWLACCIAAHPIYKEACCEFTDLNEILEKSKSGDRVLDEICPSSSRCPQRMYLFMRKATSPFPSPTVEFCLTYDGQLDIWCKIGEIDENFHILISIDRFIYMFNTITNRMMAFDVIDKIWTEKNNVRTSRQGYFVVQSQSQIFVIGGYIFLSNTQITDVERYDPTTDTWSYCAPIPSINICGASALNKKLYVIGYLENLDQLQMRALEYDIESDVWSDISSPNEFRTNSGIATFRGNVYIFGGVNEDNDITTSVEVYNAERNEWERFPSLPFRYELPHAILLENNLMVYDDCPGGGTLPRLPSCTWNEETQAWDMGGFDSAFNEMHNYEFCSINDQSVLWELAKENRNPEILWSKSDFVMN